MDQSKEVARLTKKNKALFKRINDLRQELYRVYSLVNLRKDNLTLRDLCQFKAAQLTEMGYIWFAAKMALLTIGLFGGAGLLVYLMFWIGKMVV